MTVFKYVGRNKVGALKKGTINAPDKNAAMVKLREQGINPRQLEESNSILHKDLSFNIGRVKGQDFVVYCRQFSTLIKAGVTLIDATNILARQTTNKTLKAALETVEMDVRTGIPFSKAVAKHPKVFPEIFISMMVSGETSGELDVTLDRLAATLEKQFNIKKKVQSALTYPLILLVIMIAVVIFLLTYIVPIFVETFEEMGAKLPLITVLTVKFSNFLVHFWWLILIVVFGAIFGFIFAFKYNKEFHYRVHYILLKIPGFGPLLQKNAIARLMRNLSSLFSSAVPILQALTISERISGNPVVGQVVREAKVSLEKGHSLSDPFEESWLFPPLVSSMTKIGETTGTLDFMLEKVADFYEEEVDRAVDTIKTLIEPAMIIILASVVGLIVAAVLLPMFSLYEQM